MKKLNQKGFSHHVVMFVVLALVLGAMGFAGYRVYKNRNIDAKAAWTQISSSPNIPMYVCWVGSGNGFLVRAYVNNRSASTVSWSVQLPPSASKLSGSVKPNSSSNVHYVQLSGKMAVKAVAYLNGRASPSYAQNINPC